jgi:hypothetical protein
MSKRSTAGFAVLAVLLVLGMGWALGKLEELKGTVRAADRVEALR